MPTITIGNVGAASITNATVNAAIATDAAATRTAIGLGTWAGSSAITTLGTITTGTWNGTAIGDSYISSAATWNAKQSAITFGTGVQTALGVAIGSAGAPVLFNGALGTPTSGALTNCTSIPAGQLMGDVAIARIATALTTPGAIGGTTPAAGAFSTLSASGIVTLSTAGTGTPSLPALTFSGDPDTGMYSAAGNQIQFTTGGTLRLTLFNGGVDSAVRVSGSGTTAAAPALCGGNDTNTGLYFPGSDVLGLATNGLARFTVNASGDLTADATNGRHIIANGTVRTKGYTVATLPTGAVGDTAYVTDATAPTYLGTLTGGGAVVCPVFYNGSAWVSA